MPQKKKSAPPPPVPAPASIHIPAAMDNLTFDSIEEKIRGEEILVESETRSLREAQEVKKKLEQAEIDRRMKALKDKIGRKK